ncbi:MAG: hypothetical protein LLG01_15320 [Planctomycetaceae bacterium]|nr:hypothetical protein [Planctomycetaceae bacterium]
MKPLVKTIDSQPSWIIRTPQVELAVTQLGGQLAPVTFCRDTGRPVQPYWISPWQNQHRKIPVPVLIPLRGDFFCMPFGGNGAPFKGQQHTVHGETASARWSLAGLDKSGSATTLTLTMRPRVCPGKVTKTLTLVGGSNAIYQCDLLEGFDAAMPLGHHATLAMPKTPRALQISTSAYRFGMTCPVPFSVPAEGGYQALAINARFASLSRVPTLWKDPAHVDLTAFPDRLGFTDLAAVFHKPTPEPAWTAAVNTEAGYLWFSLKDAAVLPAMTMWMSNGGRHAAPWDGHDHCLGLEDGCGYFAEGLADSARPNPLTRVGVATAVKLSPRHPTAIRYIQGAIRTPRGFDRVATAAFAPGRVTFTAASGKKITAAVAHEFLKTGTTE